MDDVVDLVRRSLADETDAEFTARVDEQAAALREAIAAGRFDNGTSLWGSKSKCMRYTRSPERSRTPEDETIAEVEADEAELDADLSSSASAALDPSLEPADPVPDPGATDSDGDGGDEFGGEEPADEQLADESEEPDGPYMDPEGGRANLRRSPSQCSRGRRRRNSASTTREINTDPDAFRGDGTGGPDDVGGDALQEGQDAALGTPRPGARRDVDHPARGRHPRVLDGRRTARWGDVRREHAPVPRYVALDNEALEHAGGGYRSRCPVQNTPSPPSSSSRSPRRSSPTSRCRPQAEFPDYYNAAIRTLGPVLALTANSPFLPADLYNRVDDPYDLLGRPITSSVSRRSSNRSTPAGTRKYGCPVTSRRAGTSSTASLRTTASRRSSASGSRTSHGQGPRRALGVRPQARTYWRWLRCVVGGDPVDGAGDQESLRIEYRPIPTQPTVADLIGTQVLVAGLVRGLVATGHPLAELPWQDARRSFYDAARNGLDAELAWVTADGERTTDPDVIYDEIFSLARAGLDAQDVPENRADEFLDPLERWWTAGETPSSWKIARVREYLDVGDSSRTPSVRCSGTTSN